MPRVVLALNNWTTNNGQVLKFYGQMRVANGPSHLSPHHRRLRHLRSILVRNIVPSTPTFPSNDCSTSCYNASTQGLIKPTLNRQTGNEKHLFHDSQRNKRGTTSVKAHISVRKPASKHGIVLLRLKVTISQKDWFFIQEPNMDTSRSLSNGTWPSVEVSRKLYVCRVANRRQRNGYTSSSSCGFVQEIKLCRWQLCK